jgi:ubiquinone/menaquinone biosynthesis C-methylase UbiE
LDGKHKDTKMNDKPIAAGKSSFDLIEFDKLVDALEIEPGITFLDVACGAGAYTLALADMIGPDGRLYALDLWAEGIEILTTEAKNRQISTIEAHVADVSRTMPLETARVDLGLMATVLHDLIEDHTDQGTLQEVARVMRPGGKLAVIEFKKMDGPPGPPRGIRLSPGKQRPACCPMPLRRWPPMI